MSSKNEEQAAELSALKSIFDDETVEIFENENSDTATISGRFIIDIEPPNDEKITVLVGSNENEKGAPVISLNYLSPLYLLFILPRDYPTVSMPTFKFQALWLTSSITGKLEKLVTDIWSENEGIPVLFNWYQSVKDAIYDYLPKPFALNDCIAPSNELVNALTDYDRLRKRRQFEKSYFPCDVCCLEIVGKDCEQLTPCDHVFCRECCRSHLTVQLKDGALDRMKCLADDCQSSFTNQQLRLILGSDLFGRYDQLSLSRGLDSMSDIVQCPRPDCGAPVLTDGPDSKLASCAVCHLPFCLFCKKVYHGIAPCTFNAADKKRLVEEYRVATGELKVLMEKRYGKQQLQRLSEEALNETWLSENSKPCPNCKMGIEKKDGCNKMTCSKCGAYFCWLCMRVLDEINPYSHFNDPKRPCFNKLFLGMATEDDDGGWLLLR